MDQSATMHMGRTAVAATLPSAPLFSLLVHIWRHHRKLQTHVSSPCDPTCVICICNRSMPGTIAHTAEQVCQRLHIQGIGHCSYHMNTRSNLSNGPSGGLSFGTGNSVKPGYLNHN